MNLILERFAFINEESKDELDVETQEMIFEIITKLGKPLYSSKTQED